MQSQREIGRSGIQVAPLCLGGNVFGWTADEQRSFEVLDAFVDGEMGFIDTADVYSRWVPGHVGGESETILGQWMKARKTRGRVIIATKVGMDMGGSEKGLRREYIFRAVEKSLQRLQTDHIDLYQAHKDDEGVPVEEFLGAFGELIKAGKVRAVGASNFSAERLEEAERVGGKGGLARFECLQPLYSLVERQAFEESLEPVSVKHKIGVISYFSLASGFLTGKYRSAADLGKSARGGSVQKYLNERGLKVLAALDAVAGELKSTPARVALAWLMARPSVTAPIASATSVEQVKDLVEAARLTLPAEAVERLNVASAWQA